MANIRGSEHRPARRRGSASMAASTSMNAAAMPCTQCWERMPRPSRSAKLAGRPAGSPPDAPSTYQPTC